MRDPEKRKKQSWQNSEKQVQPKRTVRTVADQAVVRRLWSMPAVLSEILMYGVVQALHMVLTVRGLYNRYISISVYSFQEHRLRCAVREDSNARPGDVICYNGHVGIYKGNGQIVNAINRARGIGILSATYANIITVRRLL